MKSFSCNPTKKYYAFFSSSLVLIATLATFAPSAQAVVAQESLSLYYIDGESAKDIVLRAVVLNGESEVIEHLNSLAENAAAGNDTGFPGLTAESDSELAAELESLTAAIGMNGQTHATPSVLPTFFAVPTGPTGILLGAPTADDYTWKLHTSVHQTTCNLFSCWDTDRKDIDVIIDPGATASRYSVKVLYGLNQTNSIGSVTTKVTAFRNGYSNGSSTVSTAVGSSSRYISQTHPLTGNNFSYGIHFSVPLRNSNATAQYKTAIGACSNTTPATCKW